MQCPVRRVEAQEGYRSAPRPDTSCEPQGLTLRPTGIVLFATFEKPPTRTTRSPGASALRASGSARPAPRAGGTDIVRACGRNALRSVAWLLGR